MFVQIHYMSGSLEFLRAEVKVIAEIELGESSALSSVCRTSQPPTFWRTPPFPAFLSHSSSGFTFSTSLCINITCPSLQLMPVCLLQPSIPPLLSGLISLFLHLSPYYPPYPLPLPLPLPCCFPACSSKPVKAGGSPEPSTPSRGPPAQPGWLAGAVAYLQHKHTHAHMHSKANKHTHKL